jgi:hypothetical protein
VFVINHTGLEKILALGQYRAKQVLAFLGFGTIEKVECESKDKQALVIVDLKDTSVPASCKRKNPSKQTRNVRARDLHAYPVPSWNIAVYLLYSQSLPPL